MDSTIKYNKKKIFLLKVPQIEFPSKGKRDLSTTRNPYFSLPLSLGYLGGFLREYGGDQFDVKLEDVNTRTIIEAGKKILDTHAFAEMMRFLIENTTYDVIGISSVFANNADWVKLAVTYAKEFHPGKPVILGGGYTTIFAKESLEDTKADFAVIGEGEDTLLGLLNNIFAIKNERYTDLFKEPSGCAHRLNNGEIKKEDLDHRKAMGFINVPWKYEKLNTMVYDANIHINFLNARDLNNPQHHDRLLNKWLKLAEGLQKNAVLLICLGYLYKQMKEFRKSDVYYTKANILYMEEQVQTIYGKYLKYEENPIIQDYKSFVSLYLSKK